MPESGSRKIEYIIGATLAYIVMYGIVALMVSIPLKYIFLDYFLRVGWSTDFSLLTVFMFLFAAKLTLGFLFWAPRSVQRTDKR